MVTFGEAIKESTRLALCSVFAANESVNALLSPVFGDSLGLYPASSGLRRKLCSDDPNNDPTYEPLFEGGQCPILYDVGITYTVVLGFCENAQTFTETFQNGAQGPISVRTDNVGTPGGADNICEGFSYTNIRLIANGVQVNQRGSGFGVSLVSLSVTPSLGGPDDCGDPPPPPAEPGPVNFNTDVTYNIDGDTTITVPVGFVFSPFYINPTFDVSGTVEFTVDGIEFKGEVTVSPEFNFEFNPKGIRPGPGVPDDDGDGGGGGGGGTPVPEDEDDFDAIIGVLVFSTVAGENKATVLDSTDGPNIYAPRIGSVQFAIKTGNSIGWTADQDIKNLESYVPCPAPQGAIAVRCTPAPGITRTFTPVRGRPLTNP